MLKPFGFLLVFALTHASLAFLVPFSIGRVLIVTAAYAAGTLFMLFLIFHPRNQWLVENQHGVECAGGPCVALTFDDGPWEETSPKVLAVLREKNVKATFFMVGRQAERFPRLARSVGRDGHAIGNHTQSHPAIFCFLSPRRLMTEIEAAQRGIAGATGVTPTLFRSPVGQRHPLLGWALARTGLRYVSWRLRSYDTRSQTADQLRERILSRIRPGDIVLLHDRPGPGFEAMLVVLPTLIDELRAKGYAFVLI